MPLRVATTPSDPLSRIAPGPNPLKWPGPARRGRGRFDDPRRAFPVLYAARRRRAAFVEVLARWRPALERLPVLGVIPRAWLESRLVAEFSVSASRRRWLDLRAPETVQVLRRDLAPLLVNYGYDDLDVGDVLGRDRRLS